MANMFMNILYGYIFRQATKGGKINNLFSELYMKFYFYSDEKTKLKRELKEGQVEMPSDDLTTGQEVRCGLDLNIRFALFDRKFRLW